MPDKCKRINGKRDIGGSQYVKFEIFNRTQARNVRYLRAMTFAGEESSTF